MALIETKYGPLDEALLVKTVHVVDNANERTTATEYCFSGCKGRAHLTGRAMGVGCFCPSHVKREVSMHLKQSLFAGGMLGSIG